MPKVYDCNINPYTAVDAIVRDGFAAFDCTKEFFVKIEKRIIACLEPYEKILPKTSYLNMTNRAYLYFIYDSNKFASLNEVEPLILALDAKPIR